MIHYDLDLLYEIYNAINKHSQRWNHYLSSMNESKSYFVTSFASSLIMISMLSHFEYIARSSSLSIEEIKLIVTVSWILHVSDFLRLFMMSFKYGLILLRYSVSNSVLFLSPLLSC